MRRIRPVLMVLALAFGADVAWADEPTPLYQSTSGGRSASPEPLTLRDASGDDRWLGVAVRDVRWRPGRQGGLLSLASVSLRIRCSRDRPLVSSGSLRRLRRARFRRRNSRDSPGVAELVPRRKPSLLGAGGKPVPLRGPDGTHRTDALAVVARSRCASSSGRERL